jgi:hypothetical protein
VSIWNLIQQAIDDNADKPPLSAHELEEAARALWADVLDQPSPPPRGGEAE